MIVPLAFLLGRFTASLDGADLGFVSADAEARFSSDLEDVPVPPDEGAAPLGDGEAVLAAVTSTAGLCPCPVPRPPRANSLPIARRRVAPTDAGLAPVVDPTGETARYLRAQALALNRCAPATGQKLRVHLEVTVSPRGAVDAVRITNLDPVPGQIVECVQGVVRGLSPPPFDATDPATFALTVVL